MDRQLISGSATSLATGLSVLLCAQAQAAQWVAQPEVRVTAEYSDNIRLTALPHDDVSGITVRPSVELARKTETLDISLFGNAESSRYTPSSDLNADDFQLGANLDRQWQRHAVNLNGSLRDETTLRIESFDLDTGIVTDPINRDTWQASANWRYAWNERVYTDLGFQFLEVNYDEGEAFGLLDYQFRVPSIAASYQFSPQLTVFGNFAFQRYEPDTGETPQAFGLPLDLRTDTRNLNLGVSNAFSERLSASASIGARRSKTKATVSIPVPVPGLEFLFPFISDQIEVDTHQETRGTTYDGSLRYNGEINSIEVSVNRDVAPSSSGFVAEKDAYDISYSHRISERLRTFLTVSAIRSRTDGGTTTQNDGDRLNVQPRAEWRFTRDWTLGARYSYRRTELEQDDAKRDSNSFFLYAIYRWPELSISR